MVIPVASVAHDGAGGLARPISRWHVTTACIGVPGPPANPPHRLDIGDAPRILVLNARHDPITPYSWAVDIQRQAPHNTALLTYEGWGHVAYPRSACTRDGVDDYLLTLTVPAAGSRCPGVEQ